MSSAFEQIQKAEQDAEAIILQAKDHIATLKSTLRTDVQHIEGQFQTQLEHFQSELAQSEKQLISEQLATMDAEFSKEVDAMRQAFLSRKSDLLLAMIERVINANGNSNN